MKKFSKILSMILAVSVLLMCTAFSAMAEETGNTATVTGQNLITNPGFETGAYDEWNINAGYDFRLSSEGAAEGNYCGVITNRTGQTSWYGQRVSVESGKTYLLSAKVKLCKESDGNRSFTIFPVGGFAGRPEGEIYTQVNASGWTQLYDVVVASSDTLSPTAITWTANIDYMVDDHYLAELKPEISYTGKTEIGVPAQGSKSYDLTASITNQLGTTNGVVNETIDSWELVGAPAGVSISGNQLVVSADAEMGDIQVKAIMNPSYAGAPAEITKTFTIKLGLENLITNPGFETGAYDEWNINPGYDFNLSSEGAAEGNYCGVITNRTGQTSYYGQRVPVESGKTYLLGAKVKLCKESDGNKNFTIWALGEPANKPEGEISVSVNASEWKQLCYAVEGGADTLSPTVIIWTANVDYMVDDHFMAELKPVITYTGETEITVPDSGSANLNLTASITNQLGTTNGVVNETIDSWELVGAPAGVSISEGQLTVTSEAQAGDIQVKAIMNPSYAGAPAEITKTFTISLDKSEITYNQQTLTSGTLIPHVYWINNTGEEATIKVYSALYKKVGEGLAMQNVVSTSTATVAADDVYDADAAALTIPEADGNDYIVKTFVWTNGLASVMEAGSID